MRKPKESLPRLNRELSWLAFNHRVLQEAMDPTVPLFDRLGFLAIFSSNLDEFFRVRVAAIRAQARDGAKAPTALLRRIRATALQHQTEFGRVLREEIVPALRTHGIHLIDDTAATPAQRERLAAYFRDEVAPHLAPMVLDGERPPFLHDRAVYLVAELQPEGPRDPRIAQPPVYGMVEVPGKLPRFVTLPGEGGEDCVVFLDDVVRLHLHELFPGRRTGAAHAVKLSRDAELYVDEQPAGPIAEAVRRSLRRRETGVPCRFLHDQAAPPAMVANLQAYFGLADADLVTGGRYHNLHDLHSFPRFDRHALASHPLPALPHPALGEGADALAAVAERDRILHFPYQSYEPVLRFLAQAAADPAVEEIWITLYRVAPNSAVAQSLVDAAQRGKRVTAVVEVQARFDEAANLEWAGRMEAAGVRTIHGVPRLKVHAKLLLVVRREGRSRRRYALLATGNFNERTARIYADHALLTAHAGITREVHHVFRHLADEKPLPRLRHLLVAPTGLRTGFLRLIDREIAHARRGRPACIVAKMNSLEDPEMVDALYRAGAAGVQVDVVVRGICCLAPGAPGVSPNVRARSVVDRFLEHARMFVFHDGGRNRCYLASADWMIRNLSKRVEVAFPILDPGVRRELFDILELQLADDTKARVVDAGLRNEYVPRSPGRHVRAQLDTYRLLKAVGRPPAGTPSPSAARTPPAHLDNGDPIHV